MLSPLHNPALKLHFNTRSNIWFERKICVTFKLLESTCNLLLNFTEECGALESVKAASEIISPLTGKVIEKNESVESKPGLINSACYTSGWLYKIEITNPEEVKGLMNEKSYEDYLKTDPH